MRSVLLRVLFTAGVAFSIAALLPSGDEWLGAAAGGSTAPGAAAAPR